MGWQQQVITAPVVIIQSGVAGSGLFVYSGAPGPANPPQIAIVGSGVTTDPFGNPVTSSKILMQNNVITESGGIFRTSANAPLIQLDGPHDAVLIYDAAAFLSATIAPVATNDGLGNTVLAGVTEYVSISGTRWAVTLAQSVAAFGGTLAGLAITNLSAPWVTPASVTGLETGGGANLELSSGLQTAGGQQSAIILQDSVAAGGVTGGLVVVNAGNFTAQTPSPNPTLLQVLSTGRVQAVLPDGNTYRTERLSLFSSATHLFNSATAFTIPGLSASVGIGTYRVEGIVYGVQGPNAANQIVQINGPAISFGRTYIESNADANTSVTDSNISGALPHQHSTPAWGAGVNFYVRFRGIYTFTAAGTLTVQGSTSLVANTWTSQTACLCDLMPV